MIDGSRFVTNASLAAEIENRERFIRQTYLPSLTHVAVDAQVRKWGIQDHDLAEWMLLLQEEMGEVAQAILQGQPYQKTMSEIAQVSALLQWLSEKVTRDVPLHKLVEEGLTFAKS